MIDEVQRYSVSFVEVAYSDGTGSKTRPVYVLRFDNKVVKVLRVTTKYKNKSKKIQEKYFEIIDWFKAGLSRPSWIDTVRPYYIDSDEFGFDFKGYLTERDQERLEEFLLDTDYLD